MELQNPNFWGAQISQQNLIIQRACFTRTHHSTAADGYDFLLSVDCYFFLIHSLGIMTDFYDGCVSESLTWAVTVTVNARRFGFESLP